MLLKALASGLIMSLFPFAAISAPAGPSHADSLLRLLSKTHDAVGRERIYVQLADLSGDSLELAAPYWDAALAEARKSGDLYGCKDALDFLVRKFAGRDSQRAEKYIALADSILPGPRHALFRSSLYAYYIWKLINDNNAVETVKHELDRLKTKIHNELSPEERIEWEFLTGLSLDFSSLATEAYDNIGKAIPYVEQALKKLEAYPLEERLHMERICRDELSELYMLSKDKRAEKQIQQCIGPAPRMAGDGRPLRTPPPRHDGLHDARLLEDALSARADLQREGQRILREMHGAGPRQRRSGRDLQHQRPLLPVHGGIRAGRGLHRLGRNRLQAQRHKSGFRLHIRSAVVALRESGRLQKRPRSAAHIQFDPPRRPRGRGAEQPRRDADPVRSGACLPAGCWCCCSSAGASISTSWSGG